MGKIFLEKIINKEFGDLTVDELKVIVNSGEIFSLNKTYTKVLEKVINKGKVEDKEKIIIALQEGLPSAFVLLSNL